MKETILKLRKIYFAAFALLVIIAGITYILKNVMNSPNYDDIYQKINMGVMILLLVLILIAEFYYSYLGKKSKELDDDEKQLKLYFNATIIKLALIEAAGIISAIMFFLKNKNTYLYMIGIILVFTLIYLPSELRFKKDFKSRIFE